MRALTIALGILLTAGFAPAQGQAQPPAAPPRRRRPPGPRHRAHRRLGQLLQPDRAATSTRRSAFYRDGLGLDVQGAPGDANANLPLRNMFGLPDATLRWQIARPAFDAHRRRDHRSVRRRGQGRSNAGCRIQARSR